MTGDEGSQGQSHAIRALLRSDEYIDAFADVDQSALEALGEALAKILKTAYLKAVAEQEAQASQGGSDASEDRSDR